MKKIATTLLFSLFAVFALQAQDSGKAMDGGPEIAMDKEIHDYGTIKKGANGVSEFTIKNDGNEPLIISKAKGSCGCTVPDWPKEPIMPGESAVMTVRYDTKRVGPINKSVTITSNASNEPTKVVRIKGKVLADSGEGSMPVKKSEGAPVSN